MNKGEIIKEVVEESGVKKTLLAAEMGISRGTLYNIFNQMDVDNETILKIGEIIHYDFSIKFPKLKRANKIEDPSVEYTTKIVTQLREEVDHWKSKYIALLEEHNKLLKK